MEYPTWSEDNWSALIYAIQQHDSILMLGPDAAVENADGQPLLTMLANKLADKMPPHTASWNIDPCNLAQVAQYYSKEKGKHALEACVLDFFAAKRNLTSELYHNLASLPFYLTITSTPDHLFYNALKHANKKPKIEGYQFRGKHQNMIQMGTVESPLLFYLYGTTENPKSLVLTEDDLLDFLMAVILKNPLPKNILSELRDRDKSLLFLGFGFKHWYLRIFLRVLQGQDKKENCSFALEQFTPKNAEEFQQTILFYRKSHYKVYIYHQDLQRFVKELRERYERKYAPVDSSETWTKEAPAVFLCHTRKDREYAASLSQQLKAAGFKPWFDEKNICSRTGTADWDIERAIRKSDYFVILQSKAMTRKPGSYGQEMRLRQQIGELQKQWDLLSEKIVKLERDKILQTQPDSEFRLEKLIADAKAERQQAERNLSSFEKQLSLEIHDKTDEQEQSYIKKEIRLALEHQKELQTGTQFIIPVKIEDCPSLEELKNFQIIDVSKREGSTELISKLKTDQQRRNK